MNRRLLTCGLIVAALCAATPSQARAPLWSSDTAITVPRGRWEFAVLRGFHWGVHPQVQLTVNPLVFAVMPHAQVKVRWLSYGRLHLATRHRLSSPSVFVEIFAKEGDFGLLPANTKVPIIFQLDSDALLSVEWWPEQYATLKAGLVTAWRVTSGRDMALLDFPFLYARFAALKTDATGRFGASFEGQFIRQLGYKVDVEAFVLPVIRGGYIVETGAVLSWRPTDRFALSVGMRLSYGRYPVGDRFHYLPFLDLAFGYDMGGAFGRPGRLVTP